MASYSGFIRKSPSYRLAAFLAARNVQVPDEFNWQSNGRGTELVRSLNALIDELPDRQQDRVKAELDHLASLANQNGMLSAEQICAAQDIELEGFEGAQDVLLMLAIEHPQTFERVSVQSSLIQRTGGKNWSAFQFKDDGKSWALNDDNARTAFAKEAIAILKLPKHRKREADWYATLRTHPVTGEQTEIVQATIYVEDHAESELAFGQEAGLERKVFQRVMEVGIACNTTDRILEICSKGGKAIRDQYANAFSKFFSPNSEPPVETPRREVLLNELQKSPDFRIEPADGIERVEVSSLDFYATGGGFARFERRSEDETIYQFLKRNFRDTSPLKAPGWMITGATLRIIIAPQDGQRRKTLTVTLRCPNTTTIPNKTEAEREFVLGLLERWRLIAPPPAEFDVTEAA